MFIGRRRNTPRGSGVEAIDSDFDVVGIDPQLPLVLLPLPFVDAGAAKGRGAVDHEFNFSISTGYPQDYQVRNTLVNAEIDLRDEITNKKIAFFLAVTNQFLVVQNVPKPIRIRHKSARAFCQKDKWT